MLFRHNALRSSCLIAAWLPLIAVPAQAQRARAFFCTTPQITQYDNVGSLRMKPPQPATELKFEPATAAPRRVITLREFQLASGGDAWKRSDSLPGPDDRIRIGVAFLDGTEFQKSAVVQFASEWVARGGADNVEFVFGNSDRNHIRVTFAVPRNVNRSEIGRQATQIESKSQPTMRLGDVTADVPVERMRQVIRHEFGHALGLRHEHQHPQGGVKWKKSAVLSDLEAAGWDADKVENNIFKTYDTSYMCRGSSNFDPKSIMMYPIPADWLLEGAPVGENTELVAADLACVRSLYR